jgi:hypothetical protein
MHRPVSRIVATRVNCDGVDGFDKLWRKALSDWEIAEALPSDPSPDDVRRVLSRISDNNIPIIVLDEFDRLPKGKVTTLVADTIKGLSDHSVNATIVIVGVADSVAELIKEHASIGRALIEVPMPRMSDDELAEIIEKRLPRLRMEITDSALGRIIQYSQGLPHYVHLLGLHACRHALALRERVIGTGTIDASISKCLDRAQQSIRDSYHRAIASPRADSLFKEVLLACALSDVDELGYFNAAAVVDPMSMIMGKRYEIPSFSKHLKAFCGNDRGPILEQRGQKRKFRYRFRDALMQPYIVMQGVKDNLVAMPKD